MWKIGVQSLFSLRSHASGAYDDRYLCCDDHVAFLLHHDMAYATLDIGRDKVIKFSDLTRGRDSGLCRRFLSASGMCKRRVYYIRTYIVHGTLQTLQYYVNLHVRRYVVYRKPFQKKKATESAPSPAYTAKHPLQQPRLTRVIHVNSRRPKTKARCTPWLTQNGSHEK